MAESGKPKTRFDLVSSGFGKITGGIVQLILGIILLFFWRDLGLTLILVGVIMLGWGGFGIMFGAQAPQKEIKCPQCGEANALLADVKDFTCYNCKKPLKLARR